MFVAEFIIIILNDNFTSFKWNPSAHSPTTVSITFFWNEKKFAIQVHLVDIHVLYIYCLIFATWYQILPCQADPSHGANVTQLKKESREEAIWYMCASFSWNIPISCESQTKVDHCYLSTTVLLEYFLTHHIASFVVFVEHLMQSAETSMNTF